MVTLPKPKHRDFLENFGLMNKILCNAAYSYFYRDWDHETWEKHISFFAKNFDMS